jgi:hypothetical protein
VTVEAATIPIAATIGPAARPVVDAAVASTRQCLVSRAVCRDGGRGRESTSRHEVRHVEPGSRRMDDQDLADPGRAGR